MPLAGVVATAAPRGADATAAGVPDDEMLAPVPAALMAATCTNTTSPFVKPSSTTEVFDDVRASSTGVHARPSVLDDTA